MTESKTSITDMIASHSPLCINETKQRHELDRKRNHCMPQTEGDDQIETGHEEKKGEEIHEAEKSIADKDWTPLVFMHEEDEHMLALEVMIEHISVEPERKQHYLFLPFKLPIRDLTHTILHKVGFRNLERYMLEGRLQIGVLKPLPFSVVTDDLNDSIGHLLMPIVSSVIIYIKLKKWVDQSNEEVRLEYRELPLLRGAGYLIGDYFYVCDRQSERKDTVYLRCSRQRRGECTSRAKILHEFKCAVLINENHNHPPPNVKEHEFMHRCRNESRDAKNFKRHLKDVYDEIRHEILSTCSPEELSEVQSAIPGWDAVKKIMQKCRSRAVCSIPKLDRTQTEEVDDESVVAVAQSTNNSASQEKSPSCSTKRQRLLKNGEEKETENNGSLVSEPEEALPMNHSVTSCRNPRLYPGIELPSIPTTQLNHIVPGGMNVPAGSGVMMLPREPSMMVHAGGMGVSMPSETPPVAPVSLIGAQPMVHHSQGYTGHYHMNSTWTTTADHFMLNIQTQHGT